MSEFERNGFECVRRVPQFFLPMVLHRAVRCRWWSAGKEGFFRWVGLTRRWGSPVIVEMCRGGRTKPGYAGRLQQL
jgi:hypothetical protein